MIIEDGYDLIAMRRKDCLIKFGVRKKEEEEEVVRKQEVNSGWKVCR